MDIAKNEIRKLQTHLLSIRKIAGWTAQELGEKIGVTKQTISNLENNKTEMTLTQYIAIRTVLDYEIANNPENTVLPQVIHLLLDADTPEESQPQVNHAITALTAAAAGGIGVSGLVELSSSLLSGLVGGPIVGVALTTSWMARLSSLEAQKRFKKAE